MSGSNILVTFAVAEESRPFQAKLSPARRIDTLLTGIGPAQTRRTLLPRLRQPTPDLIITSGFAGGLDPNLQGGALVYDASLAPHLEDSLRKAGATAARFHCSSTVLLTPEAKRHARQATGADAVEMESGIIQDLCREHHIPCAIVRIISDPAHERLPLDFNACVNPDGSLRWAALAQQCLLRPTALSGLLRLRATTRSAANRLAEVLLQLTAL